MSCNSCKRKSFIDTSQSGILATLVLIILPKCPFCVLAYSSTVALCSINPTLDPGDQHNPTSLLVVGLSAIAILFSIKNKVNSTQKKLPYLISTLGLSLIILTLVFHLGGVLYYFSIGIVLLGIWINGSFHSFTRFVASAFIKYTSTKIKTFNINKT